MTTNRARGAISSEEQTLARHLEFAILSVLIHYSGSYEECLPEWYSALRLGLPRLSNPQQLLLIFKSLAANGVIEIKKPGADAGQRPDDDALFRAGSFTTTLTRKGLVRWNTVRLQPLQAISPV